MRLTAGADRDDRETGQVARPAAAARHADRYRALLSPRSIAVVGASDRSGNLGGAAIANLQRFGYPGAILPVNPSVPAVLGIRAFPTVRDLPVSADMAILAVSAPSLPGMVRECAAAGILSGIAWAGGFAEGGEDGKRLQAELAQACRDVDFVLCGPNCIGIVNTLLPMAATFGSALLASSTLPCGNISVISQSGGIATFLQMLAGERGFGCRYVISSGNEAVTTTADYLLALASDENTRVVCIYVEGVKDGDAFMEAVVAVRDAGKDVVVLKAGTMPQSAAAALAHTGALAGEDRVWSAVLRELGAIRVHSLEEMLDVAMLLGGARTAPGRQGRGVGIVTFGGGGGVMAADQCASHGLDVPLLDASRIGHLRALVPPIASVANPFDLTPDTYNRPEWQALFPAALDAIADAPEIGVILFQLGALAHKAEQIVGEILAFRERARCHVIVAWPLAPPIVDERLPAAGVPVFTDSARALRALSATLRVGDRSRTLPKVTHAAMELIPSGDGHQPAPSVFPEHRCHDLLTKAGLPVVEGEVVSTEADLRAACGKLGFPMVLKGLSDAVTHRAAAGLVMLDVADETGARDAYRAVLERARVIGVDLEGVYAQRMVRGGFELIVSAVRDPVFGVMVSCGAGGNLAELIDDTVLARAPLTDCDARGLVARLRSVSYARKLLPGLRDADLVDFLTRFSSLAASLSRQEFVLEINPIKWSASGVLAVDGLLVLGASRPATDPHTGRGSLNGTATRP